MSDRVRLAPFIRFASPLLLGIMAIVTYLVMGMPGQPTRSIVLAYPMLVATIWFLVLVVVHAVIAYRNPPNANRQVRTIPMSFRQKLPWFLLQIGVVVGFTAWVAIMSDGHPASGAAPVAGVILAMIATVVAAGLIDGLRVARRGLDRVLLLLKRPLKPARPVVDDQVPSERLLAGRRPRLGKVRE